MNPRYAIYDSDRRRWLRLVTLPTASPRAIVTLWTDDPAAAWRYHSLKAARRAARMIGERGLEIRNARGERIE